MKESQSESLPGSNPEIIELTEVVGRTRTKRPPRRPFLKRLLRLVLWVLVFFAGAFLATLFGASKLFFLVEAWCSRALGLDFFPALFVTVLVFYLATFVSFRSILHRPVRQSLFAALLLIGSMTFLLYGLGSDVCFDAKTGDPLCYVAEDHNVLRWRRSAGVDPISGKSFQLFTPELRDQYIEAGKIESPSGSVFLEWSKRFKTAFRSTESVPQVKKKVDRCTMIPSGDTGSTALEKQRMNLPGPYITNRYYYDEKVFTLKALVLASNGAVTFSICNDSWEEGIAHADIRFHFTDYNHTATASSDASVDVPPKTCATYEAVSTTPKTFIPLDVPAKERGYLDAHIKVITQEDTYEEDDSVMFSYECE